MKNLSLIVLSFLFSGFISNAQDDAVRERRVDSMLSLLKFQKDTSLVLTYRAIFSTYAAKDAKMAKPYLDTAISLGSSIKSTKIQARLLTDQAYYHYKSGNHSQAIDWYKKAIDSYTKIDYQPMLQAVHNTMGINQKYIGDLEGAMNSYLESLKISKEIGDTEDFMAPTYLNIGQLHAQLGNIALSNKYYKITEAICEKFDIGFGLAMTRSNMAENMISELKYEEALPLYLSALPYFEEKEALQEMGEQYNYIGETYTHLDSLQNAEDYFIKSLTIAQKIGEKGMQIIANKNLGGLFLRAKKYSEALRFFKEGLRISELSNNKLELVKIYPQIAETYAKLNDFKNANDYRIKHFVLYDSIFTKEKVEQINTLEVKYQTEQKEAEIALQQEEIKTLNEKGRADKLEKGLYAGGMTSALALAGLLLFGFNQRIKKNRIAREKQEEIYRQEIAHKKKELTSQTLHLVQKNTFIQELMENFELSLIHI